MYRNNHEVESIHEDATLHLCGAVPLTASAVLDSLFPHIATSNL